MLVFKFFSNYNIVIRALNYVVNHNNGHVFKKPTVVGFFIRFQVTNSRNFYWSELYTMNVFQDGLTVVSIKKFYFVADVNISGDKTLILDFF
jgi:hypothetical protein